MTPLCVARQPNWYAQCEMQNIVLVRDNKRYTEDVYSKSRVTSMRFSNKSYAIFLYWLTAKLAVQLVKILNYVTVTYLSKRKKTLIFQFNLLYFLVSLYVIYESSITWQE